MSLEPVHGITGFRCTKCKALLDLEYAGYHNCGGLSRGGHIPYPVAFELDVGEWVDKIVEASKEDAD